MNVSKVNERERFRRKLETEENGVGGGGGQKAYGIKRKTRNPPCKQEMKKPREGKERQEQAYALSYFDAEDSLQRWRHMCTRQSALNVGKSSDKE